MPTNAPFTNWMSHYLNIDLCAFVRDICLDVAYLICLQSAIKRSLFSLIIAIWWVGGIKGTKAESVNLQGFRSQHALSNSFSVDGLITKSKRPLQP